ncbi:MAG: D-alanine--D-alanine ligase family protein [Leptospirales bacterium]|jgi:D-alanine-D-alanine ligase
MNETKIKVGVLFGGRSAEHEISLVSARNVIAGLDPLKYDVIPIGIDRDGRWLTAGAASQLLRDSPDPARSLPVLEASNGTELSLSPGKSDGAFQKIGSGGQTIGAGAQSGDLARGALALDVIFPVLHGTYGEDGSVQGLLKLLGVPYVGPDPLGSTVGMDKDVMKRLLRDAGIANARFRVYSKRRADAAFGAPPDVAAASKASTDEAGSVVAELGLPLYVKPANMGSSVGITRVQKVEDLAAAVHEALKYDNKILIEENIVGREIECAVLGNEDPQASIPGEIIPKDGFYSYEAKYLDEKGAALEIPAKLTDDEVRRVQELSVRTYETLCLEGMSRVDMFVLASGEIYINEVNTIPGFTGISMYPKLWEHSGLALPRLLDRLIELALDRHRRQSALQTSVE